MFRENNRLPYPLQLPVRFHFARLNAGILTQLCPYIKVDLVCCVINIAQAKQHIKTVYFCSAVVNIWASSSPNLPLVVGVATVKLETVMRTRLSIVKPAALLLTLSILYFCAYVTRDSNKAAKQHYAFKICVHLSEFVLNKN